MGEKRPALISTTPVLIVSNLQRSLTFYCEKLGFAEPGMWGEPPCFAMASRNGVDLMLSLAQQPDQVTPNGPHGVWDAYYRVSDIAVEESLLRAAGVEIVRGPETMPYQMRELEILDPDGYRICLAQVVG